MEGPTYSKPPKDKTHPGIPIIVLLALLGLGMADRDNNPHQVLNITWIITSLIDGEIINQTSLLSTLVDGFPSELRFDACKLARAGDACLGRGGLYACPGHNKRRDCGGPEAGYCSQWGCETTGTTYWQPSSTWDYISLAKNPGFDIKEIEGRDLGICLNGSWGRCHPLVLTFTEPGKRISWDGPKSWGLRLYRPGIDPVLLFSLTRQVSMAQITRPLPIGPNPILPDQKAPSLPAPALPPVAPHENSSVTSSPRPMTPNQPGTGDRLLDLIQGAYLALNISDPNRTQECWLCLISRPPYYEGIAVLGNYTNQTSAPMSCTSIPQHRLTLSEVSGQGLCIGNVPKTHQALCNSTQQLSKGSYYLAAPNGTYWACSTGLTPCVSTTALNITSDFCVLIELWPKVTYHPSGYILSHYEGSARIKREPVSLTLALLLGGLTVGGIAAGVGTGTSALVATQQFRQLQMAMHTDIKALEESVSALEKSLTSLSEVVLQNRRGLDILFLQEGGICAALKEECCFYADHTGLVRDSMAKLRERLKQRQKYFESEQGWFEGMFNRSPWFTTLISSIMGPLIILLLILLFGPCILNRLVQFMKDRLSVIQALVLTQQYQQLKQHDAGNIETSS